MDKFGTPLFCTGGKYALVLWLVIITWYGIEDREPAWREILTNGQWTGLRILTVWWPVCLWCTRSYHCLLKIIVFTCKHNNFQLHVYIASMMSLLCESNTLTNAKKRYVFFFFFRKYTKLAQFILCRNIIYDRGHVNKTNTSQKYLWSDTLIVCHAGPS